MKGAGQQSMRTARVDTIGIGIYLLVAFAAAWLICLPVWIAPGHLSEPWAPIVMVVVMFAPALGVLVATRIRRRRPAADPGLPGLGLRFGGSFRRCVPYFVFALVVLPLLGLAAPFVGALFGLVDLDLTHFSGFTELLSSKIAARAPGADISSLPIGLLIAAQLLQIPVAAIVPNGLLTFGEEIGWRGFLLPRLLPLGQWPALLITGVVWGLWHAPLLLLGYNYPLHHLLGVPAMIGFTTVTGILIGWVRLNTGSIWPAIVAHGAINASANAVPLFIRAGTSYDSALVGISGVTGWILPLLLIIGLAIAGKLPVRNPADRP